MTPTPPHAYAKTLLRAAATLEIAENLPDPLKGEVSARAERTIESVIRLLAQTRPAPLVSDPWPAPPKATLKLATDLTMFAKAVLHPGSLQKIVQKIAVRLVEAAYQS